MTPTSPGLPTQVARGPVRSQLDWVKAKMGGKSFSMPPRSSHSFTVSGLDPDNLAVDGLVVGTSTDGPATSPLEFENNFSAGFNSNGPAVAQMESFSMPPRSFVSLTVTRLDPDSPAMDSLEVGTSSNGPAATSMEFKRILSAGFNSDGPTVAQMELYGSSSIGLSSDDFVVVPGKTVLVNSHLSKGRFLADILKGLSSAGFMDFGVNSVDKVGSVRSQLWIQWANNNGTRQIDVGEIGQPNLVMIELKSGHGLPILGVSMVEEMALSKAVLGEEENLAVLTHCLVLSLRG